MQGKLVFVYRGFPADTDNKFEDFPCQKGCGVFMIYREIINVAGIPFYLELVFLFHVVQLCMYFITLAHMHKCPSPMRLLYNTSFGLPLL